MRSQRARPVCYLMPVRPAGETFGAGVLVTCRIPVPVVLTSHSNISPRQCKHVSNIGEYRAARPLVRMRHYMDSFQVDEACNISKVTAVGRLMAHLCVNYL